MLISTTAMKVSRYALTASQKAPDPTGDTRTWVSVAVTIVMLGTKGNDHHRCGPSLVIGDRDFRVCVELTAEVGMTETETKALAKRLYDKWIREIREEKAAREARVTAILEKWGWA